MVGLSLGEATCDCVVRAAVPPRSLFAVVALPESAEVADAPPEGLLSLAEPEARGGCEVAGSGGRRRRADRPARRVCWAPAVGRCRLAKRFARGQSRYRRCGWCLRAGRQTCRRPVLRWPWPPQLVRAAAARWPGGASGPPSA